MEDLQPFFSVIIPLYNKELYIKSTIQSVLSQSFRNYEIIVIDDGSTDASVAIVRSINDRRIRVFSTANHGVSAARNYGADNAKSDYIAFLDADDTWESDFLLKMRSLIDLYPDSGLYLSAHLVCEHKTTEHKTTGLTAGVLEDYFRTELQYRISRLSATVVSSRVFKEVRGFPVGMVSGEDSYFFAKAACRCSVAFTPELLVNYNKRFTGISLRYGRIDKCSESWFDLIDTQNFYKNEFIAEKAIRAGIRYAIGQYKSKSYEIELLTKYTSLFKKQWLFLYLLNRLPNSGLRIIKTAKPFYRRLKMIISVKKPSYR